MEFFDLFLAAAILAAVAMIGFTVWTVMKNRVKTPPATSAAASVPNAANAGRVDWRVYAIDRDGNCFTGSDIVLNREEDEFVIGRGESCQLKLMRPQIGRRHAMVTRKGIVYTYHDLGSNAGSICHGEKIESKRLEHLMVVMVYDVALVFANCEVQQDLVIRAVNHSRGCNY
jgi:FOG: FHA domain